MMKSILKLEGPLSPDAADALAAAVCHALRGRVRVSVRRSAGRG
jgi:Holliday junction resolvasome RuvABC endonuclease subunit